MGKGGGSNIFVASHPPSFPTSIEPPRLALPKIFEHDCKHDQGWVQKITEVKTITQVNALVANKRTVNVILIDTNNSLTVLEQLSVGLSLIHI